MILSYTLFIDILFYLKKKKKLKICLYLPITKYTL
jgi:hypothetical protein